MSTRGNAFFPFKKGGKTMLTELSLLKTSQCPLEIHERNNIMPPVQKYASKILIKVDNRELSSMAFQMHKRSFAILEL